MHKSIIVSAALIVLGLAAFLYQFAELNNFEQTKQDVGRQTSIATVAEVNEVTANLPKLPTGIPEQPWFVNYDLLPNDESTHATKEFFENLHHSGYVGEHGSFQESVGQLPTSNLLANMMLRKDEAHYLRTVSITPNMLTKQQLTKCYSLSQRMLHDLKYMSQNCDCTHDQHAVINLAVGRLTYLSRLIQQELAEYSYIGQN